MHGTTALDAMSEDEVLADAEACAETIREAEAELLRLAYQWAVLHSPDRLDPATASLPGREKARLLGGEGTPEVSEFAAAELGARIGRSPYAAAQLMADSLDLHQRLPEHWAGVEAGTIRASYAKYVAGKTRDLTKSEAAYVDAAVVESADGRIPWSRFEALVEAKVAAAAPEAAREREEKASKARFAKKLRGEAHGMATFMVRADVATIDQIDAYVTAKGDTLVESMPDADVDARRVHAVLLMANPGATPKTDVADLLPQVQLYLHTYSGPDRECTAEGVPLGQIARLEGHGPVTEAWITRVLGPNTRFKVTPVLDLAGQAPVDAYEIPDRHRQAVHLMTPADTFPYASSLSRNKQVDHTIPFDQGGQSGVGNYGPMTTSHHRIKTHGDWQVQQPFPGIYLWRDPHGGFCLVDHTGTRRLRGSGTQGSESSPRKLLVLEIYRTPWRLELDAA
jgi:hypothetical protein